MPISTSATARHGIMRILGAAVLLLTTAACGVRWTDDQRAGVLARHEGGSTATTGPASGTASPTAQSSDTTGPANVADSAAAPTSGTENGQAAVAAAGGGAATRPCAAPSNEIGVTDATITVGSISSLSGPVPGAGATADAATRAYVAYRNATGGVCGREIKLKAVDDGLDNGRNRSLVTELSDQVLGITGGLAVADAGGADVLEKRQVPVVTTAVTNQAKAVSTLFDLNPLFEDVNRPIGKFAWLAKQGVTKAALVWLDAEQSRPEIKKQRAQMLASGIKIVHENPLPASTLSYDSAARGVANSGADYLFVQADAGGMASMAKSMKDTGYKLKFSEYLSAYGSTFSELAGPSAEGSIDWIPMLPYEERGSNPELDRLLEWIKRVAPNVRPDAFSAGGWAGPKAFFDALEALPGPISRKALVDQFRATETYDAGGMFRPTRLGAKRNTGCFIGMRYESGAWKRIAPSKGFLC